MPRNVVFVSHANPEDNDFSRWLTLQLAQHGYTVWCDVANLIGGEDFWRDIEAAIRNRSAKFLFVLSQASNTKEGALNELSVAKITERREQLKDFIIPLKIDDIPYGDMNIEIARLNAVPFKPNWASGLSRLLEKLEEDSVPREPNHSRAAVATWWKRHFSPDEGVKTEEEEYASNWFEIAPKPERLFFHEMSRSGPGPVLPSAELLSLPVVPHGRFLISFAEAGLLSLQLGEPHKISRSIEIPFDEFVSGDEKVANIEWRERRSYIANLLRQSWMLFIRKPEVASYELANGHTCVFYTHRQEKATRMPFKGFKGGIGFRALTGYKTVSGPTPDSKKKRYWHFAVSMRPLTYPILGFAVYYHVLFSDDGRIPWESKERMHAARRRQCRDWWNDDWRDRMIAFLTSLAKGGECLLLPAGETSLRLSLSPLLFTSPRAYEVTGKSSLASRKKESEAEVESEEIEDEEEMDDDNDIL